MKRIMLGIMAASLMHVATASPLNLDFGKMVPNTAGQRDRWEFVLPERSLVSAEVHPTGPSWYILDRVTIESDSLGELLDSASMPGHAAYQRWFIDDLDLPAGTYSLIVDGHTQRCVDGYYAGNVSVSQIPEPGTLALLLVGIAGLGQIAQHKCPRR